MIRFTRTSILAVLSLFLFGGQALADAPAQSGRLLSDTPLGQGRVIVTDFGILKLHDYATADAMGDHCYVLETADALVAIEGPAFNGDLEAWKKYTAGLGKTMTDVFVCAHPTGGRWFGKAVSHATASAAKAIAEGGTGALAGNLAKAFGSAFNAELAPIDAAAAAGETTVAGIRMNILDRGDMYDIFLPEAGIYYTHMLGADTHSILVSPEHMDAVLKQLEDMLASGATLIISGHHDAETRADVKTKIEYVKKIREIAAQSTGRADFVSRVKTAFPGYKGENYLDMSAGFLFKE